MTTAPSDAAITHAHTSRVVHRRIASAETRVVLKVVVETMMIQLADSHLLCQSGSVMDAVGLNPRRTHKTGKPLPILVRTLLFPLC
jgi:hypothetical protein